MLNEWKGFLNKVQCEGLIAATDGRLEVAPIMSNDPHWRIAESCWLDDTDDMARGLKAYLYMHLGLPPHKMEPVQIVKYVTGGEYKPHVDYLAFTDEADRVRESLRGGQRVKTAMVYLNDDYVGGVTLFTKAGVKIKPECGKLVLWDNVTPDGYGDPETEHSGLPVKGTKWIALVWIRQGEWR